MVDVYGRTAGEDQAMFKTASATFGSPRALAMASANSMRSLLSALAPRGTAGLIHGWRAQDERDQILRFIQPSLIGLIDGTISTLAPIFAAAFLAGSHAAFLVGLAASLGAAISMGLSEALSDDGELSGRGSSFVRGVLTGTATFVGGTFHSLPFLISDIQTALNVAYVVVGVELVAIAWVRRRFLQVPLHRSLVQVTMGGCIVAAVGALMGHA
jgi:erythrin-vacuolar iron transport family protein